MRFIVLIVLLYACSPKYNLSDYYIKMKSNGYNTMHIYSSKKLYSTQTIFDDSIVQAYYDTSSSKLIRKLVINAKNYIDTWSDFENNKIYRHYRLGKGEIFVYEYFDVDNIDLNNNLVKFPTAKHVVGTIYKDNENFNTKISADGETIYQNKIRNLINRDSSYFRQVYQNKYVLYANGIDLGLYYKNDLDKNYNYTVDSIEYIVKKNSFDLEVLKRSSIYFGLIRFNLFEEFNEFNSLNQPIKRRMVYWDNNHSSDTANTQWYYSGILLDSIRNYEQKFNRTNLDIDLKEFKKIEHSELDYCISDVLQFRSVCKLPIHKIPPIFNYIFTPNETILPTTYYINKAVGGFCDIRPENIRIINVTNNHYYRITEGLINNNGAEVGSFVYKQGIIANSNILFLSMLNYIILPDGKSTLKKYGCNYECNILESSDILGYDYFSNLRIDYQRKLNYVSRLKTVSFRNKHDSISEVSSEKYIFKGEVLNSDSTVVFRFGDSVSQTKWFQNKIVSIQTERHGLEKYRSQLSSISSGKLSSIDKRNSFRFYFDSSFNSISTSIWCYRDSIKRRSLVANSKYSKDIYTKDYVSNIAFNFRITERYNDVCIYSRAPVFNKDNLIVSLMESNFDFSGKKIKTNSFTIIYK